MSEFINRIAEAVENGDLREIEGSTKGYLTGYFEKSLRKQLTESGYFPDLSPMYSEKYDDLDEAETAKLQEEAVKKVQREDFLLLLEPCDWEAIKEIAGFEYLSLFEVALLFGYKVANDPMSNIYQYIDLFIDASLSGKINPREPSSKIPYRNIPKSPVVIDGEITLTKPVIDLSWELTRKEAYDFAIAIGYPEKLFADLIGKTDDQIEEVKNADIQTNFVGSYSNPRHEDAINSLLKIVLGMAIDAYQYDPDKTKNAATGSNSGSIHAALAKIDGLATDADTIRKYLTEAVKKYPTAKQRKS